MSNGINQFLDTEAEHSGTDSDKETEEEKPTKEDNDFIDDSPIAAEYDRNEQALHRLHRFSEIIKGDNIPMRNGKRILPETETQEAATTTTTKNHQLLKQWEFNGKNLGLTYPQCSLPKQELLDHILSLLNNTNYIIVSEEDHHETDGKHLHVAISLQKSKHIKNQRFFDYKGHHPHFEPTRDTTSWVKYVIKDGNYTTHPTNFKPSDLVTAREKHKAPITAKIANDIQQGASIQTIYTTYGSFMVMHGHQVQQYYTTIKQYERHKQNLEKWSRVIGFKPQDPRDTLGPTGRICGWLNNSLVSKNHKFGTKNLWLHGKTKMGKTTLKQVLKHTGLNVHEMDLGSNFYDGISDDTQLIIYDEFKAQKTMTDMNRICDGQSTRLNIKGGSFMKEKPTPVLVLSNDSIEKCYHNMDKDHLETLQRRFYEIEITKFIFVICYLTAPEDTIATPNEIHE